MISQALQCVGEPPGHLRALDRLCDEFEASWRGGHRPALKDFITRAPAEIRPDAFRELLALEIDYRKNLGEELSPAEYHSQFAEFAAKIDKQFDERAAGNRASPSENGQPQWPEIPGLAIERLLGKGGMGIVYLAQQQALKRRVALKVLRSGAEAGDEERSRFRREVESAADQVKTWEARKVKPTSSE